MTDLTRRSFFRLVAGATAMAAVPATAWATNVPTIWCDGVNDDGPGLSALIQGDVVHFRLPDMAHDIGWRGHELQLNGDFTIRTPIITGSSLSNKTMRGGHFDLHCTGFNLSGSNGAIITMGTYDCSNMPDGSYAVGSGDVKCGMK